MRMSASRFRIPQASSIAQSRSTIRSTAKLPLGARPLHSSFTTRGRGEAGLDAKLRVGRVAPEETSAQRESQTHQDQS